MATEFREAVLDGAGLAMGELAISGDPAEAQIGMALMAAYLCCQGQIDPDTFIHVLRENLMSAARDPGLMSRVVERVHNHVQAKRLAHKSEPIHVYESHRVGDLLAQGIQPGDLHKQQH